MAGIEAASVFSEQISVQTEAAAARLFRSAQKRVDL